MTTFNNASYNTSSLEENPLDFDKAPAQGAFPLIPDGTILRVKMWIRLGNYKDQTSPLKWADGYATKNLNTGSVYLSCEYTVAEEGPYYGHKVWGIIGLHSDKSTKWADMGRSFIRAILNSARGYREKDESLQAREARKLKSLAELNNLEFVARIDVEMDKEKYELRNVIKMAITKGHDEYAAHSGFFVGGSDDRDCESSHDIPYEKSW